jgi:Flp pilus assembly protein TadD
MILPLVSSLLAGAFALALFRRMHVIPLQSESTTVRESVLYSENAFYYSHFADVLARGDWAAPLADARSEFGHTINAVQRFNLTPELALAVLARVLGPAVDRLDVYAAGTCLWFGLGVGLAVALVARIGKSSLAAGAALAALAASFTHASRIELHLALRENFGMTALFLLLYVLCGVLDRERLRGVRDAAAVVGAVALFLLVWQFATFLMFALVACLAVIYALQLVSRALLLQLLALFGVALGLFALLMFGSAPMYTYRSLFFSTSVSLALSSALLGGDGDTTSLAARAAVFARRCVAFAVAAAVTATLLKFVMVAGDDDDHIFDVLMVRLGLQQHGDRFQVRVYTTQAEFDGPAWSVLESMHQRGLSGVLLCGAGATLYRLRELRAPELLVLGMAAVGGIMFLLMMRFQVLATPLVVCACAIVCGPLMSLAATPGAKAGAELTRRGVVLGLVALLGAVAVTQVRSAWNLDFAFNSFPDPGDAIPRLCSWVRRNADRSVFATDMVTGSQLRLCSNASIVCHPQYEDAGLRARTRKVYELHGHRHVDYLYSIARQVRADFVVLNKQHCAHKISDGSRSLSIVDRDWEAQGNVLGPDSLCESAFEYRVGGKPFFDLVHNTKQHWVLRVRDPGERLDGAPSYVDRLLRGADAESGAALCSLAEHARSVGDEPLAQQLYAAARTTATPDAACLSQQAREFEASKPAYAHELYRKSLQLEPRNAELLSNYAIFLDETGDAKQREEAGALYRRAIQHGPWNPTYAGNYAIFLEINKDERAREYYERAAASAMCDANTLCAYAIFLHNSREVAQARAMMQRAQKKDANNQCVRQHGHSVLTK